MVFALKKQIGPHVVLIRFTHPKLSSVIKKKQIILGLIFCFFFASIASIGEVFWFHSHRMTNTKVSDSVCKNLYSLHESEVDLVFSPLLCRLSSVTLQEQEHVGGAWLCLWRIDWNVVVCYWLISCEWQVIAPPSSSDKRGWKNWFWFKIINTLMMCTHK